MAKYRRYRKYSRRAHAKWAPNIQEIPTTTNTVIIPAGQDGSTFYHTYTLAFNPTQINTAVSQIYTVKNFDISFMIDNPGISISGISNPSNATIEDVCAYIMFVPQGMNITENYNLQHPEYIMAMKYLGGPTPDLDQQYQPFRIKTRLSRKLNTGDQIVLFVKAYSTFNNTYQNPATLRYDFHGLIRWWTKAN